jgi:flagellar motility protein MotE (MotC chaperone)
MKIMFVLASCMLAVALSVIAGIIATGIVPFRQDKPVTVEESQGQSAQAGVQVQDPGVQLRLLSDSGALVTELVNELKVRIEAGNKRAEELAVREQTLEEKALQMALLEKRLAELHDEVKKKIVQISDNEEANFKKLAEMYSKMDPESAAKLLQEADSNRAAKIISLIADRQAAAIMNATVSVGRTGAMKAAEWTDAMRRMNDEKKAQL